MIEHSSHDGPIRVLLVEDDEDDYILTQGLLTTAYKDQFSLHWAKNFEEGISQIVRDQYDVALVDYRLGVRDGVQLIREARQQGCRQSIILLTGLDDREVDLAATRAGASDFLSKSEVTSAMLDRSIRYSMQNAKLEEQRVRLLAERSARAEAEAGSRAKDRFLATLSHELRTPLTPVMMAISAMSNETSLPASVRQDLEMIRRNVELEARLIDDLLDITRITRGTLQLRSVSLDVHGKLRAALDLCESDITSRRLTVTHRLDATQATVSGDPGRVQQIFWNLVQNAVKFTPAGGAIEISTWNDEGSIVAEVKDNGMGIDPMILPRLFDAFEQGSRPDNSKASGGLGLGLAISKALADLHGGTLQAASDGPGKGAVFTLRLPLATLPAPPAAPRSRVPDAEATAPSTNGSAQKPRILFVEDHVDTAQALVRVLSRNGFEVQQVGTVASAIAAIGERSFDLLISDIGLPDGNGLDVMRAVRQSGKAFPGVAVSGYGMAADVESARNAGFEKHLTKPVHPDVLIATVNAVLRLSPTHH